MPGIEPGAFHMQSERATTALHPLLWKLWPQNLLANIDLKKCPFENSCIEYTLLEHWTLSLLAQIEHSSSTLESGLFRNVCSNLQDQSIKKA